MEKPTCIFDGCEAPARARGLCKPHYGRARRSGTLEAAAPTSPKRGRLYDPHEAPELIDCDKHGPDSPTRRRKRESGKIYVACRACDRGSTEASLRGGVVSPEARRAYSIWGKYGLSEQEYMLMLSAQGGRCLICQKETSELVIDHCHETGVVRGLLCHHCNVGLGWFRDSQKSLRRAAQYLNRRRLG